MKQSSSLSGPSPPILLTLKMKSGLLRKLVTNWLLTDPNYTIDHGDSRNYQMQKYADMPYVYCFGGRFKFVKHKPISLAVATTIIAGGVLFWVFEASWFWHNISPAVVVIFSYLWFLLFMFFVKCSTSDAGIQPRNVHLPFDFEHASSLTAPDEYFNTISLPYYSDRYHGVSVKYCATCHIWRLPRMSHCGKCNSCVLVHDHHCVYLNNCIGARNYRYFLWFLLCAVTTCVFLATLSFVHLFHYRTEELDIHRFSQSASRSPVALLLAILSLSGVVYPTLLLAFHLFLTANNITTREFLNNARPLHNLLAEERYVNVFDTKSVAANLWLNWIASPQGLSLVKPREKYISGDIRLADLPVLTSFEGRVK